MAASHSDNEAIFHAARRISDPDTRREYVRAECGGDEARIAHIEALLAAAEAPDSLLDLPASGAAADGSQTAPLESVVDLPLDVLAQSDMPGSLGRLGHYEVLEVLGQGGFGIVVRAYDEKLHRMIAIKIMSPRLAATSPARKRFMREARSSAAIRHENVVDIHAIEEQPIPFLVMEYVAGETLQQRLDRVGPLETLEVLRIGVQIAHGLAAAHAMGKIHRDIKPANILLENGVDRVKITDFGMARAADDASLTQSGLIAGTPMYMAPEQAQGVALDHRADLFSFGSVLYVMCSGRPPFRASTTLAVLKRVAEDTPRPIREIIPEVPEWLCDIVTKLHAKNPSERYQTAPEVADVLSKYLSELQVHGKVQSFVPPAAKPVAELTPELPPTSAILSSPSAQMPAPVWRRGRRLAVAAAVLLCLVGGLLVMEATGVIKLRSTAIRIFTPDGTLMVETDDPGVKVTIEGDDGLVITGASLDEIPLRPGNYKVHAERDGKPVMLDRELVSISEGAREVVRVKLEAPPALAVAKSEKGAFVLVAAGKERKFDTLAEAVQTASDGDTIEVRGNGPFVSDGVDIRQSLVIRAGDGFTPSITLSQASAERNVRLLSISAPLVLEGLELRWAGGFAKTVGDRLPFLLEALDCGSLHIANCRLIFKAESPHGWPFHTNAKSLSVRNSVLSGNVDGTSWRCASGGRCNIENCVSVAGGIGFAVVDPDTTDVTIRIRGNTLVGNCLTLLKFGELNLSEAGEATPPIRLDCSENVARWDATTRNQGFLFFQPKEEFSVAQTEAFLPRFIRLDEKQNVYQMSKPMLQLGIKFRPIAGKRGQDRADWDRFWAQKNTCSVEGDIQFQGGDLIARARSAPELIIAEDFRLRPESAGYRAGKDGKDLGADVDLVGPGKAYERWKKTPEYQQWLKDTGQFRAETTKPEAGAFVRLGAKGVAERKFDTLDAAVLGASPGDTIEVRGNGPFICDGVTTRHPLVIRAGVGYVPVITLSKVSADINIPLVTALDTLVLEGLDLRRVGGAAEPVEDRHPRLLIALNSGALHVANCRLLMKADPPQCGLFASHGKAFSIRNAVLSGNVDTEGGMFIQSGGRYSIDNCVCAIGGIGFALTDPDIRDVAIRVRANTLVGNCLNLTVYCKPNLPKAAETTPPIRLELSRNIANWNATTRNQGFFFFHQSVLKELFSAAEAEAFLPRFVRLDEKQNVYRSGTPMLSLRVDWQTLQGERDLKLADWDRLWAQKNTGSVEGDVRFEGGDLVTRARSVPEKLNAELFRLREDSAGYKAAKDGKDLGADVDLVGPGPAYERWKKSPEYQQWLKDTGQLRAAAPKPEPGAFVLMGGKGVAERKFDTLAEAVLSSSDGDIIEVRGNGPFVSDGTTVRHSLVIRAGDGYSPLITQGTINDRTKKLTAVNNQGGVLVLEGLQLEGRFPLFTTDNSGALHLANCRLNFKIEGPGRFLFASSARFLFVRNSILSTNFENNAVWFYRSGGRCNIDNCVTAIGGLQFSRVDTDVTDVSVCIRRNTFVGNCLNLWVFNKPKLPADGGAGPPLRLELSGNVASWDGTARGFLCFHPSQEHRSADQAEALLQRLVHLDEKQNVYRTGTPMLSLASGLQPLKGKRGQDLADWDRFWGQKNTGSVNGDVHFQGGDLSTRARSAPEQLTAEDFRLRPDSAGYKAGKDGKDLGADVDLVGPGPAYERWKKTPDYQNWRKDTGQRK